MLYEVITMTTLPADSGSVSAAPPPQIQEPMPPSTDFAADSGWRALLIYRQHYLLIGQGGQLRLLDLVAASYNFV